MERWGLLPLPLLTKGESLWLTQGGGGSEISHTSLQKGLLSVIKDSKLTHLGANLPDRTRWWDGLRTGGPLCELCALCAHASMRAFFFVCTYMDQSLPFFFLCAFHLSCSRTRAGHISPRHVAGSRHRRICQFAASSLLHSAGYYDSIARRLSEMALTALSAALSHWEGREMIMHSWNITPSPGTALPLCTYLHIWLRACVWLPHLALAEWCRLILWCGIWRALAGIGCQLILFNGPIPVSTSLVFISDSSGAAQDN